MTVIAKDEDRVGDGENIAMTLRKKRGIEVDDITTTTVSASARGDQDIGMRMIDDQDEITMTATTEEREQGIDLGHP